MSNTSQAQLSESSKPLLPCGSVWYDRLTADQLPLARQAAGLFNHLVAAQYFDELGNWLLGAAGCPVFYPWSFKPQDVLVQGPETWGYEDGHPTFYDYVPGDVDRARPYLLTDGRVVVTAAGDPSSLEALLEADVYATLAEQTVWFIRRPADYQPVRLISVTSSLVEGTDFRVVGDWVLLYQNPQQLWPSGVIVSQSVRYARSWKSTSLRVNELRTGGRELALYRRNSQSLRQFERALCEAAGLPLLDFPGTIVQLDEASGQFLHWLEDGRSFVLPGRTPYVRGSVVEAGAGHLLSLRHVDLQGADWWRSRPWAAAGIPIFVFRPNFFGFSLKDEQISVHSYTDSAATSPNDLRARFEFGQDQHYEDLYWTWQSAQETRAGTKVLADILGFTTPGEVQTANPLETYLGVAGRWLAVVETSLDVVNTRAFSELQDFIERERPSGLQVYLAGESQAFTAPSDYGVYLNTGELTEIEPTVAVALPLGY